MRLKLALWALLFAACHFTTAFGQGQAPATTVSGRILDSSGVSLPNVSVLNLRTGKTSISDSAGNFKLLMHKGDPIEISTVGYQTKKLTAFSGGNIYLTTSNTELSDVVVVGYGTAQKKDLTGAVDQISGSQLARRPIANVFQGLQGASPGLNITYNGGQPGSTPTFNIRGFASINDPNGSPLVIIDGIASTTDDLLRVNPSDIATITVLRDASSAAIYGARAAFGVVLLTTRQGSSKQNISYNNYFASSRKTLLPEPVTDPFIYMKVLETSTDNTPWDYVNYSSWL